MIKNVDKDCGTCKFAGVSALKDPCIGCSEYHNWQQYVPKSSAYHESALGVQVAGDHYKNLKIQPVEYIHANKIPFIEGCIIKYATRWRDKGGTKDLEKIKHFADLLIELEKKNGG